MASNSYFSHDSNARNSKKMLRMRQKLGALAASAYGVYWMLVERLREEEGYECEKDYDMLAYDFRVDKEVIRSVVEDFGLFDISEDGNRFSSHGLGERMAISASKAEAGKRGAIVKWGKKGKSDEAAETRSERLSAAREKGTHTKEQWEDMKSFFGGCVICGKSIDEVKITKDHIVPIYQGGSDSITNLQPLCSSCNSRKGPDNHDYRIDWCARNKVEMPREWLVDYEETPSRMPGIKEINELNKSNYSSSFSSSLAEASDEEKKKEEQEQIVFDFTFNKNWASPNAEYEKLVAFNNRAAAKKKWNDMSVEEKQSVVTIWRQKPEGKPRFSEEFLHMWRAVYDKLVELGAPRRVRLAALADGVNWTRDADFILHVPVVLQEYIERNADSLREYIWPFMQSVGYSKLMYKSIPETEIKTLKQ